MEQVNQKAEAKAEASENCLTGQTLSAVIEGINATDEARVIASSKFLQATAKGGEPLVDSIEKNGYKAVPNGVNRLQPGDIAVFSGSDGQPVRATVVDYTKAIANHLTIKIENKDTEKPGVLPRIHLGQDVSNVLTVYRKDFCVNKSYWDKIPNKRD